MIGHRQMTAVWMMQDDVAPLLVVEDKPEFPERFDRVAAGDNGQRGHQAATLISTISGQGMGRFCARRTSIFSLHRFPDVFKRLFSGLSLGDASWKRRAFGHNIAVFPGDSALRCTSFP